MYFKGDPHLVMTFGKDYKYIYETDAEQFYLPNSLKSVLIFEKVH